MRGFFFVRVVTVVAARTIPPQEATFRQHGNFAHIAAIARQ
jgi:hypothetical protein